MTSDKKYFVKWNGATMGFKHLSDARRILQTLGKSSYLQYSEEAVRHFTPMAERARIEDSK